MRSVAFACLLVGACGPVLLFGDTVPDSPTAPSAQRDAGIPDSGSAGTRAAADARARETAALRARIAVRATDCGRCFELVASGSGGVSPYRFEWEDGSQGALRHVCASHNMLEVTVVAVDATAARSPAYVTQLETEADASCPSPVMPARKLCVINPSFEGIPAANIGIPETFDAAPWSVCTNPAATNMPDIGTDTGSQTTPVPKATDGNTFLALGAGEQVSQKLCETVPTATVLNIQIDLARVDLGGAGTQPVFLEIWGGIAADCSQRQLLWASAALEVGWKRHCIKLKSTEFMDQITLRGKGDTMALAPSFVLVDNLAPVDDCP